MPLFPEISCHLSSYSAFGSVTTLLDSWVLEIKQYVLKCTRIRVLCVNVINTVLSLKSTYFLSFTGSHFFFNNSKLPQRNIENCQHHPPHPCTLRCEGMRQVAEIIEARRGGALPVMGLCCSVPPAPGRSQAWPTWEWGLPLTLSCPKLHSGFAAGLGLDHKMHPWCPMSPIWTLSSQR